MLTPPLSYAESATPFIVVRSAKRAAPAWSRVVQVGKSHATALEAVQAAIREARTLDVGLRVLCRVGALPLSEQPVVATVWRTSVEVRGFASIAEVFGVGREG